MNKQIKIWCTYNNQEQLNEYNLYNTDILQLYNTNDFSLNLDNINNLNMYLSELVTYYYVWKNQLKTDYIGFCHYRRHFINIDYDYINNRNIQVYNIDREYLSYIKLWCDPQTYGWEATKNGDLLFDLLNNYFISKYKYNLNDHFSELINIATNISYIMVWSVFNDICDFIFGLLDYIGEICNTDWKTQNGIKEIIKYLSKDKNNVVYDRYLSYAFEYMIGLYIGIYYNTKVNVSNNLLIYNIDDKNTLYKMYKLNIKTGVENIINVSDKIQLYGNDIYHMLNLHNISNSDINKFIKENKNKNIIILKSNEYIDCIDSFNFNAGNYQIKQI